MTNLHETDLQTDELNPSVDFPLQKAFAFVQALLSAMDMDAEVRLVKPAHQEEDEEEEVRLEITGPDAQHLIGKQGAVLDAIQHLTTRIVSRTFDSYQYIVVDADGYRVRRNAQLAQMAQRLGERVAREGKVITFDPMNARDRRVVHRALQSVEGICTESKGDEPNRQVQILPLRKD